MSPSHRYIKFFLYRFILPCFAIFAFFVLALQIGNEISHIKRLAGDVQKYQSQLNERKLREIELRREKIVMEMDDYKDAIAKANGAPLDDGEERVVVR